MKKIKINEKKDFFYIYPHTPHTPHTFIFTYLPYIQTHSLDGKNNQQKIIKKDTQRIKKMQKTK